MKARTVRQSLWLLSVRLRLHHLNQQNQDSGLGFTILDIRLVAGCPFLCLRHIENKKAGTECHSFLLLFRNTYSQNDIWVSIETSRELKPPGNEVGTPDKRLFSIVFEWYNKVSIRYTSYA